MKAKLINGQVEYFQQPDWLLGDSSVYATEQGYKEVINKNGNGGTYETETNIVFETPSETLEAKKQAFSNQLAELRKEIAEIIINIQLLYEVEPEQLTQMKPMIRGLYPFAKSEIEALTEETIETYALRGVQVDQLLSALNSML